MLSKLMKLVVKLGDSFGADRLIGIKSAHTVLNFGANFIRAAAKILNDVAEAGLRVKVRTTADPVLDANHKEDLKAIWAMFPLHEELMRNLARIGVHGFTCTPYFLDNKPDFGDHCAWSESSAVIYLNSVLGGRSNREGGVTDIASAITGKTPNHGLHLKENRRGQILFKILFDDWDEYDLTSIGLKIGEVAGSMIPVIEGLHRISTDNLKNLGSATASTGAVSLIHVIGFTPEAKTKEMAFQNDKPEDDVEIDRDSLKDVRKKYSTEWEASPVTVTIGCPHLSKEEVLAVLKKLEGKRILPSINFWICTNEEARDTIRNSKYSEVLKSSGAKLASFCPMLTLLPRPVMTNSAKTCFYTNATYRSLNTCIKVATESKK